jgi:hypothetical protein
MKDIATHLTKSLQLHEVSDLDDVLERALVGGVEALEKRSAGGGGSSSRKGSRRRSGKGGETGVQA